MNWPRATGLEMAVLLVVGGLVFVGSSAIVPGAADEPAVALARAVVVMGSMIGSWRLTHALTAGRRGGGPGSSGSSGASGTGGSSGRVSRSGRSRSSGEVSSRAGKSDGRTGGNRR